MARDILDTAPFLSPTAPREHVVDYSGRIDQKSDRELESYIQSLNFKAKVVILPSDFSTGSMSSFDSFCRALAQKWHVNGERFILVVDLKGKHVRGLSGNSLQGQGVDSSFISLLIKDQFVPHMKRGELSEAIQNTLAGVQAKVAESKSASSTSSLETTNQRDHVSSMKVPPDHASDKNSSASTIQINIVLILVLGIIVVIWVLKSQKTRQSNQSQKLFDELKLRLATLYERADAIGQASEFLNPSESADLAKDVANFFNRVGALSATQSKLETMKKKGSLSESYDQLRKIQKMVDVLEPESDKLLSAVNAATGGTAKISESPEAVALRFEREAELAVQKDKDKETEEKNREYAEIRRHSKEERFRRPTWSYEPTYYQPVVYTDPWQSLSNWMVMWNQMELENRMDRMNYEMDQMQRNSDHLSYNTSNNSYGDGGGSWGNDSGGSSWGDSGGDSGWGDSGGGDSGGGDFGGGDGGGSW
ncbi:MAG: TPM domain-containing protein [Candidatus Obscuribacterales bacterium]|nr:TPM domain-containing protein [Candidatus Obscuribacterales bacterium]